MCRIKTKICPPCSSVTREAGFRFMFTCRRTVARGTPFYLIIMIVLFIAIAVIVLFILIAKNIQDNEDVKRIESSYEHTVYQREETERREKEIADKEKEIAEKATLISQEPFFKGVGGKINMAIKGLYFRTTNDIESARQLCYGDIIYLVKDIENEKDAYAVAVYTKNGAHIGYIPREYSMGMTQLLDLGIEPKCMITKKTFHEIPYLYMDVYYKNSEQEKIDERLESELVEKFKRLGFKETSILRWDLITKNRPKPYETTVDISAYRNNGGFDITETLKSKDKIRDIRYFYMDNIGKNNYEIAEKLEKSNELEMAIKKYEENIDIEEVIAASAIRLSILYKKIKQYQKIIPMLKIATEKARKFGDDAEINKLNDRLNMFLNNASFMKKYGGVTEDKIDSNEN